MSLLFCNCACSLEYSSLSTLAGLSYHRLLLDILEVLKRAVVVDSLFKDQNGIHQPKFYYPIEKYFTRLFLLCHAHG